MSETGRLLLSAALVGAAVSAPPGPLAAACVARTLRHGLPAGLWTGLGAALGDTFYAGVVLAGIATFTDGAWEGRWVFALVAAPVLLFAGVRVLLRARREHRDGVELPDDDLTPGRTAGMVGSAVFLALGTPGTLPGFLVLFAALHLPGPEHPGGTGVALVCAGVAAGCLAWWIVLCSLIRRFRERALAGLPLVEYVGGALLLLAGATAFAAGVAAIPAHG